MEQEFEFFAVSFLSNLESVDLTGLKATRSVADASIGDAIEAEGGAIILLSAAEYLSALGAGVVDYVTAGTEAELQDLLAQDETLMLYKFTATSQGVSARENLSMPATTPPVIVPTPEADVIELGDTGEVIDALGGNDIITNGGGNDTINGNTGEDTAIYTGGQNEYTLTIENGTTTLTDRTAGRDGTDQLIDVENLAFNNTVEGLPFELDRFDGASGLTEEAMRSFIELYIAYFNRAPDAVGLNFWGTSFATGTTLEQSAALFIDQDEYRATYPDTLTNADFVTAAYTNVLGRIGDQVGFDFWVGVLNDGSVTRDQFVLELLKGAKAAPPVGATQEFIDQQLADRQFLSDKTDIGAFYALINGLSNVTDANNLMAAFDGTEGSKLSIATGIETLARLAEAPDSGEFIFKVLGIVQNPFPGFGIADAMDDGVSTAQDTSIEIDVLANDFGSGITIESFSNPANGTSNLVSTPTGNLIYTPNTGFVGSDQFIYTIIDANGATDVGTVSITVGNDQAPPQLEIIADFTTTQEETAVLIDVLANDTGEMLSIDSFTQPASGFVELVDGALLYTPDANFNGEDVFGYTVIDQFLQTDGANVTVTVQRDSSDIDDDSFETAQAGQVGTTITSEIDEAGDLDFYSFDITPGQTYSIFLEDVNPATQTAMFLWPSSEGAVAMSSDVINFFSNTAQEIRIGVSKDPNAEAGSLAPDTGNYELTVNELNNFNDLPANDRTPIHIDLSGDGMWDLETDFREGQTGQDNGVGDSDWYGILMSFGRTYQFDLSARGFGNAEMSLRIYDDNGNVVAESQAPGDDRITFTPTTPIDQYFVEAEFVTTAVNNVATVYDLVVGIV